MTVHDFMMKTPDDLEMQREKQNIILVQLSCTVENIPRGVG